MSFLKHFLFFILTNNVTIDIIKKKYHSRYEEYILKILKTKEMEEKNMLNKAKNEDFFDVNQARERAKEKTKEKQPEIRPLLQNLIFDECVLPAIREMEPKAGTEAFEKAFLVNGEKVFAWKGSTGNFGNGFPGRLRTEGWNRIWAVSAIPVGWTGRP